MKKHTVCVYTNERAEREKNLSLDTKKEVSSQFEEAGFFVSDSLTDEVELLVTIGGDGATLAALHEYDFPNVPIVGVNTGHLGFFQEIDPAATDRFVDDYKKGNYSIQEMDTVEAEVTMPGGATAVHTGLNEIVIRGSHTCSSHLDISIGDSFIERFSGDGILISSPAGSTAYNYSVGGSIIDPRLSMLQVTPIAPMNTTAYRSFTSSILLPADMTLGVIPEYTKDNSTYVSNDGNETRYENLESIRIGLSGKQVRLIRFASYDFWNKVKTKFL